jgi:predicted 3-demethylubiquinone-9 3-methyltransferase (glyoxalase superfamily)
MRVMVIVKATKNSEAGVMPSEKLLADMGKYNEELVKAGVMLAGEGLHPSSKGKRVVFSGGKKTVVDGPFVETKELIAGFWLWQVKDMDEALEWARRCPDPMPGEEGTLELRPVFEADDFGKEFTPELRAQEERLRAQIDQQSKVVRKIGMAGTKIFPHLWYAKEAEEAARFYASVFPDSRVDRVTTLQSATPSGPPGSVKVVDFTLFGQRFQAITAGPHDEFNDAISLVVSCDDQAELDRYWNALLENGGKAQACGWLIDRFGVRWQIVPAVLDEMMRTPDPARSKKVTDALLQMVKLDIAALEKAYGS